MQRTILAVVMASLFGGFVACAKNTDLPKSESLFKPKASIQEIMSSIVDPNADDIWNSVSSTSTAAGIEEHQPKTDEEWQSVRRHAITLQEATNLLLIEGRRVAPEGASTAAQNSAEWGPKEIQGAIDAARPDFIKHAHDLHEAVQQAIVAIDAKNPEALVKAGGAMDQICEQCHKQFWYPNDKLPLAMQEIGLYASNNSLYLKLRTST